MLTEQNVFDNHMNRLYERGMRLAEEKDVVLYKDDETLVRIGDISEGLEEKDDWIKSATMLMVENTYDFMNSLDETTRTIQFGKFPKFAFPLVRAVFPNLIAHELVSVQPMSGPTGLVFYQRFTYGTTKGAVVAGQDIIEVPNDEYASERITAESFGTAGATNQVGTLGFSPVRPHTFQATDGVLTVQDDGNGNIVGDTGAGTNTIDYRTGAVDFDYSGNSAAVSEVSYVYVMEGNTQLPELEMTLESTEVRPIETKLRAKWTVEASHDLRVVHGEDLENNLVNALGLELKFEIDRRVIRELKAIARATAVYDPAVPNGIRVWEGKAPSGISFTEHKLSIIDTLTRISNDILGATQRARGQWIVCGLEVANVLETLPGWRGNLDNLTGRGVFKAGTLNSRWTVYVDTYGGPNDILIGYKGDQMFDTGYVLAPYVPFYATPLSNSPNAEFVLRKAIASRYATKAIDSKFYANGAIDLTLQPS